MNLKKKSQNHRAVVGNPEVGNPEGNPIFEFVFVCTMFELYLFVHYLMRRECTMYREHTFRGK